MKKLITPFILTLLSIEIAGKDRCLQAPEDPPVVFPHEYDCSKFYKCSHGAAHELDCPGDLYFNPKFNRCDWRYNVNCTNEDSSEEESGPCPPAGEETEDVFLPHDCDCSKYFQCSNGEVIEMKCPANLYFNPNKNQCDWPQNVDCVSTTESSENGNSEESESEEDDILLPHETDCSKFYKISNGVKHEMTCPDDLYFNPDQNECDWPHNVNCTNPKNNENVGGNKDDCARNWEDPEIDVLLPHEEDCSKFYKCSHGQKIEMDCPKNLVFNPDKNYCDRAGNVKCIEIR